MATSDLLAKRKSVDQDLTDHLVSRLGELTKGVDSTRSGLEASRVPALENLLSQYVRPGTSFAAPIAATSRKLASDADVALAGRKAKENQLRLNLVFQNAMRLAQEAKMDQASAVAFARDSVARAKQRDFETTENDKQRQFKIYLNSMANSFNSIGNSINSAPQQSMLASILRALSGSATSIGSAYILSKGAKTSSPETPAATNVAGANGYDPYEVWDRLQKQSGATAGVNGFGGE